MDPPFVPGLELSRRLYTEAVGPLLAGVVHTAALIGHGSDVLGFDTPRSRDHDWGPRMQLFVGADRDAINDLLATRLPATIAGYSTHLVPDGEAGVRHMRPATGRIRHAVVIARLDDWLPGHLGFDPEAGITTMDWLATPT